MANLRIKIAATKASLKGAVTELNRALRAGDLSSEHVTIARNKVRKYSDRLAELESALVEASAKKLRAKKQKTSQNFNCDLNLTKTAKQLVTVQNQLSETQVQLNKARWVVGIMVLLVIAGTIYYHWDK